MLQSPYHLPVILLDLKFLANQKSNCLCITNPHCSVTSSLKELEENDNVYTRKLWCCNTKPTPFLAAFLKTESSQRSASGISASSLPVSSLLLHGVKTKGAKRSSLLRMGMTSVNHQCSSAMCSNFIFPSRI